MKNQSYSFISARSWWWLAVIAYTLSLSLLAVWSFSLTDPNLVFTSWAPYWQTQTWLWQNIYADPTLQARLYVLFVSLVMASYGFLIFIFKRHYEKQSDSTVTLNSFQGPVGNIVTTLSASIENSRHPELVSGSSNGTRHAELVSASTISNKHFLIALVIILIPLLFSYNALSHDMFNYLFNAKMVLVYQANPHVQVALDFPYDDWTRFMHNTHTPAPYWYGWTSISLIPFSLGLGKFTLSWWLFRLFSVLSWVGLWWSWRMWGQWRGQPVSRNWMLAIALLPLMLIEIIANGHNDLWMMVPAILSLGMILYRKLTWQNILGSIALLAFSISIKYATAVLIPLWLLVALSRFLTSFYRHAEFISASSTDTRHAEPKSNSTVTLNSFQGPVGNIDSKHSASSKESSPACHAEFISASQVAVFNHYLIRLSPLIASILLFIPLLTSRSQQFLPWYLNWSLVWIPLFVWNFRQSSNDRHSSILNSHRLNSFIITFTKIWTAWLLALSISALFRYVSWLLAGGDYSDQLLTQQKWILWGGGVMVLLSVILISVRHISYTKKNIFDWLF